ncbi:MAG: ATP phosphoribosyltransferase [Legionella longbeachae]|nr:ATP phosphoribosyltransferase [Legionella longbeachae]
MKNRLRLALQKKGRLAEESLSLLQQCGLKFRMKPNTLLTHVDNFPIDLLFVRDDDIPILVFDRLCDGGIVGENVLLEASLANPGKLYKTTAELGTCTCRLSIAIPESMDYINPGSLEGKRIATSYPNLLNQYLRNQKISAESIVLSGSIEVAPRMGIMLARRIQAVQQAQERKYIVFHAPKSALEGIAEKLPGAESPTILPLPGNIEKVAVHVVSSEKIFWNTLETIQSLGASSILVLPIEKMLE